MARRERDRVSDVDGEGQLGAYQVGERAMIGTKRGNKLCIEGEEIEL
jgi:hypothetical protein